MNTPEDTVMTDTETNETPSLITNGVVEGQPLAKLERTRKSRTSSGGDVPSAIDRIGNGIADLFAQAHAKSAARRHAIAEEIAKLQSENETLLLAEGGPRIVQNLTGTHGSRNPKARPGLLLTHDGEGVVTEVRTRAAAKPGVPRAKKTSRLARRSDEQIDALVDKVVALVKKTPEGLRAEAIREALHLEAKELPRVFARAKERKVLRSKGQKRATAYFARG